MTTFKTIKEIVRVNTFWWKFQEKLICIQHTHLFYENPCGLHNSISLRPEPLAKKDDNHPVNVGHYIWDLGLEGGQGVMKVFIDLSVNCAPHEIISRVAICWAGRPHFLQPVVHQVGLQLAHGCAWQWGHPHGQNTAICHTMAVCLSILVKIFLSDMKIIWFGLDGFLLVRKGSSKAARVAYSADMFLKIKTVCLLDVKRCYAFQWDPQNISMISPNLLCAPCTWVILPVRQKYGSEHPEPHTDPYQNVTEPQHCPPRWHTSFPLPDTCGSECRWNLFPTQWDLNSVHSSTERTSSSWQKIGKFYMKIIFIQQIKN